jgi:hypothetical protein
MPLYVEYDEFVYELDADGNVVDILGAGYLSADGRPVFYSRVVNLGKGE